MVDQVFALMGWIVVFGVIIGGVIAGIARFVERDSTQYDMTFLWEHRYTLEELELDRDKQL
ncbi:MULTISPECIES: hypothetical protein [unclassified Paenibacillus]|uniref:hypothetical protein n=1 Tax=unclassified Paenibacillus TaxID=185978 RepID=UPI0027870C03|nr:MULTISPECIES: hypothetical protein [unclassified Paenibacillus]MDQ0903277.1 hypothetical protein [Paenibacillus sp. V4I7]MDQ0918246.1 hypothetical protein [Paenibacillus sp. V4I5]